GAGNQAVRLLLHLPGSNQGGLVSPRPGTMAKYCEPLHSVHHPKESSLGANHARVFDWKQRIRAALG
ncbi:hypothetical protein CJF40_23110, partial [Pseudomonas lundensis]